MLSVLLPMSVTRLPLSLVGHAARLRAARSHRRSAGAVALPVRSPTHRLIALPELLEARVCLSAFAPFPGVQFNSASFSAGGNIANIAVADFNRDGKPDVATSRAVSLGREGTFDPQINFPASLGGSGVAAGDFNGDGKPDLVVSQGARLKVGLGNGDGTFTLGNTFTLGSTFILPGGAKLIVADFNGDGALDVATSDAVLLGDGHGNFSAPIPFPGAGSNRFAAVGDFNADGVPDLAVTQLANSNTLTGQVEVLLGKGDGTFRTAGIFNSGDKATPNGIAVADFNRDGRDDLVVANTVFPYGGDVAILNGNGDGTFGPAKRFAIHTSDPGNVDMGLVTVGDFNGDARPDVAVTYLFAASHNFPFAPANVFVLPGNGHGGFAPPVSFSLPGGVVQSLVAADIDRNGQQDLLATDLTSSGRFVTVLFNRTPRVLPPDLPVLSVNDVTQSQGTNFQFTVTLSSPSNTAVTVHYGTRSLTAGTSGDAYQGQSNLLTFAPGQTTKTVTIRVFTKPLLTGSRTFQILLTSPINALISNYTGDGTIVYS